MCDVSVLWLNFVCIDYKEFPPHIKCVTTLHCETYLVLQHSSGEVDIFIKGRNKDIHLSKTMLQH